MIHVIVRERDATAQATEPITSGSVGMEVSFRFSEDWDGLGKAAIFQGSGQSIDVLLTEDRCVVPHEVLQSPLGHLKIGVYGTGNQGQRVTPTIWADAGRILPGVEPSQIEPTPATQSLVQQILEAAETVAEADMNYASRIYESIANKGEYAVKASDLESGYWAFSTKAGNSKRLRNVSLFPVKKGMTVVFTNPTLQVYFGILETPDATSYLAYSGWITSGRNGATFPIAHDGWMTFMVENPSEDIAASDYDCDVRLCGAAIGLKQSVNAISDFCEVEYVSVYGSKLAKTKSQNGITFSYDTKNNELTVNGTASALAWFNLFAADQNNADALKAGKTYSFKFRSSNGCSFSLFSFTNAERTESTTVGTSGSSTSFTIPADSYGVILRLNVPAGKVCDNDTMKLEVFAQEKLYLDAYNETGNPKKALTLYNVANPLPSSDLNELDDFMLASFPGVNSMIDQLHLPFNFTAGYSQYLLRTAGLVQLIAPKDAVSFVGILNSATGIIQNWMKLTEGSGGTANYIPSPGGSTDMTAEIQAMLNSTGTCKLGPGAFYVTGIEIPDYGYLEGSGNSTVLMLSPSVTSGSAIRLKSNGRVSNLRIRGSESNITLPAAVGTRHGILFEGTADAAQSPSTKYRSQITNCFIYDFVGGGITMSNTGYNCASNLLISDCLITRCGAGINISYFSEFHRITNVTAQGCLYGCVDNGGNNNFANCDFSGNTVGLLVDDSQGQSPNNTHGSFVGCSFNHSGGNTGTAIRILGGDAGLVFTAAQIFFGGIEIEDSVGVRFIGANFGRQTPISVRNSHVVVFSDCTFYSAAESPITQSGNTRLVFDGCYLRDGSVFDGGGFGVVGDLADLTTTEKENLVSAINELDSDISALESRLDALLSAQGVSF